MFDRQLSKSRALISGTSSLRIILQRWSFNDINLYPCSCSKDNNHDHFFLFDCVTPKSWNCSLTKNPLLCSLALYRVERGKLERVQGRCSNCKPREAGGLEEGVGGGGGLVLCAPFKSPFLAPADPDFQKIVLRMKRLKPFFFERIRE